MKGRPTFAAQSGSELGNKLADVLMEGWQGFHATRLQLRGPEEQDMGGLCRDAVVKLIDKELTARGIIKPTPKK